METFKVLWIETEMPDLLDLSSQLNAYQTRHPSSRLVCVMTVHRNPGERQCYRAVWASPFDIDQ